MTISAKSLNNIVANFILKLIKIIINHGQTGFIPQESKDNSNRTFINIIHHINVKEETHICREAKIAFKKIQHPFLT